MTTIQTCLNNCLTSFLVSQKRWHKIWKVKWRTPNGWKVQQKHAKMAWRRNPDLWPTEISKSVDQSALSQPSSSAYSGISGVIRAFSYLIPLRKECQWAETKFGMHGVLSEWIKLTGINWRDSLITLYVPCSKVRTSCDGTTPSNNLTLMTVVKLIIVICSFLCPDIIVSLLVAQALLWHLSYIPHLILPYVFKTVLLGLPFYAH